MQSALLSYDDAEKQRQSENVLFLDATFVLPGTPVDPKLMYRNKRIGNAQFFDVDEIADQSSSLPHMLPDQPTFEREVAKLGVSNDTTLIIYGQNGLALGPARAWWMFRIFGHENVFILNGSMNDWEAQGFPVETSEPIIPEKGNYQAKFHREKVVNIEQVNEISSKGHAPILDARPAERFYGEATEPRPGMRSGHIPNSINIPTGTLINPATGGLKEKSELQGCICDEVLKNKNVAPIMTCGSGVTACVIALAFYELGHDNWQIYDGSWTEWGASDYPIETL